MKDRIKKLLSEATLYLTKKELPLSITQWVEGRFKNIPPHIKLIQGEIVTIDLPWHEAAREYYQAFKMVGVDKFEPIGETLRRSGSESFLDAQPDEEVKIPVGGLVVCYCTYPKQLTVYTGDGALPLIADKSSAEELSNNALVALYSARSLKAFARPKFDQSVYDELIVKGYMMKNKSITTSGRNALIALGNDKLSDVINKYNEDGQERDKYFNRIY